MRAVPISLRGRQSACQGARAGAEPAARWQADDEAGYDGQKAGSCARLLPPRVVRESQLLLMGQGMTNLDVQRELVAQSCRIPPV